MKFKWAVGAAIAVAAGAFLIPGVASAHHPEVNADVQCDDGTFVIDADYIGGNGDRHLLVYVDDTRVRTPNNGSNNNIPDGYAPDGTQIIPDGMEGTISENDGNFNWVDSQDKFNADGSPGFSNFFVLEGTYDSVDALDDDEVEVTVNMYNEGNNNFNDIGTFLDSASNSVTTDDFWSECGLEICLDGQTGVEVLSFKNSDTDDCDPASLCVEGNILKGTEFEINQLQGTSDCEPVRLCVDGHSITVTEHDAESLEGEPGSCVPTETPPPPPPTTEEEPPVEDEVEDNAVAEVSPAVDEVVALPAAGYGDSGNGFAWTAIAALALVVTAGGAALVARRR